LEFRQSKHLVQVNLTNDLIRNLVTMDGHNSDDQNRPSWLTTSNIINLTVEYDLNGIRTNWELKFWQSKYSVQVNLTNYPIRHLVNMEGHYSDHQNKHNRLTISNIVNPTVEYDLIGIRMKLELKFQQSESPV